MSIIDFDSWIIAGLGAADRCVFLQRAVNTWSSANSRVTSLPAFDLLRAFSRLSHYNVASSLVSIAGPSTEPLHFHTSHVFGVATKGRGVLRHKIIGQPEELRTIVEEGDVALIPSTVLHLFETEDNGIFEYIAVEVSEKPIDYQKHWHEDALADKGDAA